MASRGPGSRGVRKNGMNFDDPKTLIALALAVVAGAGLVMAVLKTPRAAMWTIAGLLFFSSLAGQDKEVDSLARTWLRPLQVMRKDFYLGFGLLTLLAVLAHRRGATVKNPPIQGVLLLGMNLFAGILDIYHQGPLEGVQRVVFMTATIGPVLMMAPLLMGEGENFLPMLRMVGTTGALWAGACCVQFGLDRSQLVLPGSSRFTGMLGNPQGTAVYLGPMCTVLTWLILNETRRRLRWVWMLSTGAMLIFLIWTGSRTGALMYIFGITGVLYARLGRAILLVPVVVAAVYGAFQLLVGMGVDIGYGADRLLSGQDTRTEIWMVLMQDALQAPLFGLGGQRQGGVENSLLLGWVIYGPLMLLFMLVYMALSGFICLRLLANRRRMSPSHRSLADLVIGFNAMYFAGSMFEWFIMARVDSTHVLMVLFGSIATVLLRQARAPGHLEYEDWKEDHGLLRERYGEGYGDAVEST